MPIYMNYDSLSIKGGVTEGSHKHWIELNSFQWGVGRGISAPTGNVEDRESSAPSVSEVTVTKDQDVSTIKLIDESLQGEGKTVLIEFLKTDKGQLATYLSFKLENTMISGFSMSSGGDRPSESLSLNFTKVEVKATQADATGKAGTPSNVTYDLGQAKVV
jgi:type VI secretion system secreted protein Hcp